MSATRRDGQDSCARTKNIEKFGANIVFCEESEGTSFGVCDAEDRFISGRKRGDIGFLIVEIVFCFALRFKGGESGKGECCCNRGYKQESCDHDRVVLLQNSQPKI
jgi:hypothetical protein